MTDYDELREKYGETAARAAMTADAVTAGYESGRLSFGEALVTAAGSAYRPIPPEVMALLDEEQQ